MRLEFIEDWEFHKASLKKPDLVSGLKYEFKIHCYLAPTLDQ